MSDRCQEAAIAREDLLKNKKLLTKENIVLEFGESSLGAREFCGEYNDSTPPGGPCLGVNYGMQTP